MSRENEHMKHCSNCLFLNNSSRTCIKEYNCLKINSKTWKIEYDQWKAKEEFITTEEMSIS
jgi:hypothetical protein